MTTSLIPFETRYPEMFEDFRREVDGLMNRFFDRDSLRSSDGSGWFSPSINVAEAENSYEITVDLPGMKPDDFNVELRDGDLWISGERKQEHEETKKSWHVSECRYGQFRRMIRLGDDVQPDQINAEYVDGVLKVTVPKSETSKPRRIPVK